MTGPADEGEVSPPFPAFRPVPRTGVIYVMTEAYRLGYRAGRPDWANLGQGQPETGPLEGAPPRVEQVSIAPLDQEYAPVPGVLELREAVAALYNQVFRRGKASQYTAENVSVAAGGRISLARAVTAIGQIHLGHFLPDYTAYGELLEVFRLLTPLPIALDPERAYRYGVDELRHQILSLGLGAILLSNPCNPMGKLIHGEELSSWVETARELNCSMLFDEYYSHYIWRDWAKMDGPIVSAARFVEDVDRDPVLILDGLTKNWRYPGWRVGWTVGPRDVIERIASAGSFLDGGGSRPLQRAAIGLVSLEPTQAEALAIQRTFGAKRARMMERLRKLGVRIDREPDGTFYVWGSVRDLPPPLNSGMAFFEAGLARKVITVPGEFFDVNPGKRRHQARESRFARYVRFSFGPDLATMERGLDAIEAMVLEARR